MDELLTRFMQGTDPLEVQQASVDLSRRNNPEDVPVLIGALGDPMEMRRWGAAHALRWSYDRRAVVPLMKVLDGRSETPWVRGEAAESLGFLGQPRAIKPLIRGSRDPSPDVRFWCVFALGQVTHFRRKKLTRAGFRALENRLDDWAEPHCYGYWPIRFEALAMLNALDHRASAPLYEAELQRVLDDPVANASLWPWASFYANDAERAAEKIIAAGLDPATLGRR